MTTVPSFRPTMLLAALAPLWLALACSVEEQDPNVEQVGLRPIDVRETNVDPNAIPANGDGGGEGGDEGGEDGSVDGVDPDATDSLSLFRRTTYPNLVKWCGGCHGTAQSPFFASPDPVKAHDALLVSQKVDLGSPELSRIVQRQLNMKDKHNCPDEAECKLRGNALLAGVTEWKTKLETEEQPTPEQPKTAVKRLAEAEQMTVDGGNPPGVIPFEAESGTLKAPFAMVDVATASGLKVVATPAGAGTQNNVQTAAMDNNLGTVIYDFEVKEDGTYRLHGLVNTPTLANNGFWIRMDNGNFLGWRAPANAANYNWDLADAADGAGAPHQFVLTAGTHRLEIRQREEQAKIDKMVLTNDPMFDPATAGPTTREVNVLKYDISDATGIAGSELTIEVSDYSTNAYMFKNPTINIPSGEVVVKNMKLLINGIFLPQHATYTIIDKSVAAPGGILTSAALVALKDKALVEGGEDEFSFVFEVLEAK